MEGGDGRGELRALFLVVKRCHRFDYYLLTRLVVVRLHLDPQAQVVLRKDRLFVDQLDAGVMAQHVHVEELVGGVAQHRGGLVVEHSYDLRAGVVFHSAVQDEAALGFLNRFVKLLAEPCPAVPFDALFLSLRVAHVPWCFICAIDMVHAAFHLESEGAWEGIHGVRVPTMELLSRGSL
jgi:hypothetical protein